MTAGRGIPLGELARIGPYFALQAGEREAGTGWQPVSALITDPPLLGSVLGRVAGQLGGAPLWIAASVFYQGWAARLTAVHAGSAVLCGAVPDLAAAALRYRFPPQGPVELLAVPLTPVDPDAGWHRLEDEHLGPLAAAIRGPARAGGQLLRGNLASALAGALAMLAATGHGQLADLISRDWAQPAELRRYGRWHSTPGGLRFARTTCCGYYLLPGGGRCGDCALSWRGGRPSG